MKNFFYYLSVPSLLLYQAAYCQDNLGIDYELIYAKPGTMPPPGTVLEPGPEGTLQSFYKVTGLEDDLSHICFRDCSNKKRMKCRYKFMAEWYYVMSKACYDCPYNLTDCFRPHCTPLDGLERPLYIVNRRFPGPSIMVCEGDEIIVDVENELSSDSTTIHWHGIHQIGTPYMDGVPFVNQCPIYGGLSFRYHFIAEPAGTHFWHSHSAFHRDDGMFGALIVRSRNDAHESLYDVDDPKNIMMITDWMDNLTMVKFVKHRNRVEESKSYNILVNGFGKHLPFHKDNKTVFTPLYEFQVEPDLRYRFRSIYNGIENCPIEISVDSHKLLVIASDGKNIEPLEVDSLVLYSGERWDFVIAANQSPGVYWVKYRGILDCDQRFYAAHQVAVLRYEGAEGFPGDAKDINYYFTIREGVQLNTLNAAPGDLETLYTAADIRSYNHIKNPSPYARTPDHKFYIYFDFNSKDDEWYHHTVYFPITEVDPKRKTKVLQMNNISLKMPNAPPLSQPDDLDQSLLCNDTSEPDCVKKFCHCTHTLNVKLGSLVEFILIDIGFPFYANHPFHLHGYSFAVLGMERLGEYTTLEEVKKLDREGTLMRNFVDPPLKDTVTVPDGGYTILRFIADNPGYWLFHCHVSYHNEEGMGFILHVGEKKHLPPVPKGFPKCNSWGPKPVNDLRSEVDKWLYHLKAIQPTQTENPSKI